MFPPCMSKEASATPAPGQPKRHLNSTVRARERLCSSFPEFAVADMVDYLTHGRNWSWMLLLLLLLHHKRLLLRIRIENCVGGCSCTDVPPTDAGCTIAVGMNVVADADPGLVPGLLPLLLLNPGAKPVATFGNEFDYIRNSLLAEKVPSSPAVMVVVVVVVEDRQKQRWSI